MFLYSITSGLGKDKEGRPLGNVDGRIETVRAHLAAQFGGFSEERIMGGYRMKAGGYAEEPAVRWDIVANGKAAKEIKRWAGIIRDLFHQESVLSIRRALDAAEFV